MGLRSKLSGRHRRNDPVASENRKRFEPMMQSITYDGITMSGKDWAEYAGLPYMTFKRRYMDGWPMEKALDQKRYAVGGRKKGGTPNNRRFTVDGISRRVSEWSRVSGIPQYVLHERLRKGYTMGQALNLPYEPSVKGETRLEYDGRCQSLAAWSRETGLPIETLHNRYKSGYPMEKVFATDRFGSAVVEYGGKKQTLLNWAVEKGIPVRVLRERYDQGLPPQQILDTAGFENLKDTLILEYDGRRLDLDQWSTETNIPKDELFRRYVRGMPLKTILKPGRKYAAAETVLLDYEGLVRTIPQWSEITGIPVEELLERYRRGFAPKDILYKHGNRLFATPNRRHRGFLARFRRQR